MTTISAPMMPSAVRLPQGRRVPLLSSPMLAMLIFIAVELMFFAGLMSAWSIVKSTAAPGAWPPPFQPRLPIETTAVNTAILLASGVLGWLARRAQVADRGSSRARTLLLGAVALGVAFVAFQGFEWVRLLGEGLTMRSSTFGSFFYLIVGAHALHALVGLGALLWSWRRMRSGSLADSHRDAVLALWTFVVALWPALYVAVYL